MITALNKEIISFLIKGSLPNQSASTIQEAKKSNNKQKLKTSKDDILNTEEMAQKARSVEAGASNSQQRIIETIVREKPKIGRNDFVKITNGEETKEIKFKKAKPLIDSGEWKMV